jgi:hypothetical protein
VPAAPIPERKSQLREYVGLHQNIKNVCYVCDICDITGHQNIPYITGHQNMICVAGHASMGKG